MITLKNGQTTPYQIRPIRRKSPPCKFMSRQRGRWLYLNPIISEEQFQQLPK
jgi:hypothetical protein